MTFPGTDAGRDRPRDPNLAKALSHPLRPRRGALEHYYRAIAHPWCDAAEWAQLPALFRRQTLARTLRDIVSDAADAGSAGGFDEPDAQVRRVSVALDRQGWQEVAALLDQTLASVRRIHFDSALRAAEDEPGCPILDAELALLLFRRAPQ